MVIETTACPGDSGKRIFFGLKKNGRYFFNNKTEETPFYLFIAEIENESLGKKYESEIFIAKINEGEDKEKEYIVSIGKGSDYAELYDFDNNRIYHQKASNIIGIEHENLRSAALTILSSDNKYYSLYGFINEEENKFIL